MPHGSSARRNWCRGIVLGAAVMAAVGCAGKDKADGGLRSLDPRVKAALGTPDGPKPLVSPKVPFGDPNATGQTNLTAKSSFDRSRPFLPAGSPTGHAVLTQPAPGVPTPWTNGGNIPLERSVDVARGTAPPVQPFDGPLPKPQEIMPVGGKLPVPEPLQNPTPTDVPAPPMPIVPAGAMPAPTPPPAPTPTPEILPIGPSDNALIPIPSPTEKQVTGFPIAPTIVK